ncbi:MAG: c-type cytochrome [Planctomycetota bacterium]
MADRGDTAYSTNALHVVFAISSIALLVSLVWMLFADYGREWKGWQRKGREVDIQRVNADIVAQNSISQTGKPLEEEINNKERDAREQEKRVEENDKEYQELVKRLEKENGRVFATDQEKKFSKAKEDSIRYTVEKKRQDLQDPRWGDDIMAAAVKTTEHATLEYQTAVAVAKETEAQINAKLDKVNNTRKELAGMRRELDRLKTRRDDLTSMIKQGVLNAPGIDFIAPTLQIRKTVLEGLFFELNFTKKKRIDMCMSCHVFIDMPGYETHTIPRVEGENFASQLIDWKLAADVAAGTNKIADAGTKITKEIADKIAAQKDINSVLVDLPQPLRSHPRLDLYLSAASPHPMDTNGCTVCHRGSGESVGFTTSDHTPEVYHKELMNPADGEVAKFKKNSDANEKQAHEWKEKYHWHKQHHWDFPMLPASSTEASCLQCHKDSMETIREAAPTLYRGWQLVEEKGCYSCHKMQGWRDNRRSGPTLTNIAEKLQKDFAYSWIENPKNFRPSSRMPQIFHLENTIKVKPPEKPVLETVRSEVEAKLTFAEKSNKGIVESKTKEAFDARMREFDEASKKHEEIAAVYKSMNRDYETNVWDDVSIHGVVSFLFNRSKKKAEQPELINPPSKGDAEKGKEQFVLAGCLGCHMVGEGETSIGKDNPYGTFGPNLEGIGSKVTEKWLYNWVKDPHAWWPDTRMPNMKLAEDEATNIAAYLATLKKEGWAPVLPPLDINVLDREAMTFLTSTFSRVEAEKRLRQIREGNFDGTSTDATASMDKKLWPETPLKGNDAVSFYVGERYISRQGCYSCHEIRGLEEGQAIGVELTEWGSKEVEKLDFGLLEHTWEIEQKFGVNKHPYMNLPGSKTEGREPADGLNHINRLQWLSQKLRAPRSYDRGRDKAPLDIWRMPYFDLTESEIHAISTYVMGLVKEGEVDPSRKMQMTTERNIIEKGSFAFRSNNCIGCHILETEKIEYKKDKEILSASGLVTVDEPGDEDIALQLWEPAPRVSDDPEEGKVSAIISIPRKDIIRRTPAYGGGIFPSLAGHYQEKESKGLTEALPLMPPILKDEGDKVRAPWTFGFLKDPYVLRPIVKVHMPNFKLTDDEAKAISQFFPQRHLNSYIRRVALEIRQKEALTQKDLGVKANLGGVEKVKAIEAGTAPPPDVRERLLAYAKEKKVITPHPPEILEYIAEREKQYRDAKVAEKKDYFDQAWAVMTSPTAGNCFSCHYNGNEPPTGLPDSWAPDLSRVKERLRPDWVYRWLIDPQVISPGTKMPVPALPPEVLNTSTREHISAAMKDVMMNWEYLARLTGAKQ